jgi:MFS family permease
VQGASATVSGLLLTPMMVGVMVTSIIAGQITSRTGRYKMLPVAGSIGMGAGMYLLSMLGVATTRVTSGLFFVVLGLGMGLLMQITSMIAQNSVELKDIGVASSSRLFFQQIGGSIGVSVFGAIFARRLTDALSARLPGARPLTLARSWARPGPAPGCQLVRSRRTGPPRGSRRRPRGRSAGCRWQFRPPSCPRWRCPAASAASRRRSARRSPRGTRAGR